MGKIWNAEKTTYYGKGRKPYVKGDALPDAVIKQMGEETVKEFTKKGWITDGKTQAEIDAENVAKAEEEQAAKDEAQRNALIAEAKELGLKPHHNAGVEKLQDMIGDHKQFEALKTEAAELGIDVTDDMDAVDLQELVDLSKIKATAEAMDIEVDDDMDFDAIKALIDDKASDAAIDA